GAIATTRAATAVAAAARGGGRRARRRGRGAAGRVATGARVGRARRTSPVARGGLLLAVDRLDCAHDPAPDQRGIGPSVDRSAVVVGGHGLGAVGVTDPDAGREVVGPTAEPGVA